MSNKEVWPHMVDAAQLLQLGEATKPQGQGTLTNAIIRRPDDKIILTLQFERGASMHAELTGMTAKQVGITLIQLGEKLCH
ncbi:hypothetical protein [Vibrio phage VpKK5]|uniref:hypothetical protein n=1 Tax=Vibrio phage VpKK5 TaxID=1538804 RepID=UPI0004F7CA2A|nr:hypothetical protein VC55_gp73 [Vibrio phage VpKK5]AIM40576.1 hypothetical protein [Vibrio phage VpKK5]